MTRGWRLISPLKFSANRRQINCPKSGAEAREPSEPRFSRVLKNPLPGLKVRGFHRLSNSARLAGWSHRGVRIPASLSERYCGAPRGTAFCACLENPFDSKHLSHTKHAVMAVW